MRAAIYLRVSTDKQRASLEEDPTTSPTSNRLIKDHEDWDFQPSRFLEWLRLLVVLILLPLILIVGAYHGLTRWIHWDWNNDEGSFTKFFVMVLVLALLLSIFMLWVMMGL